jgi:hypothetical protein
VWKVCVESVCVGKVLVSVCVYGKCECVCVCQCSSGQQFGFHTKSCRQIQVDRKSLTNYSKSVHMLYLERSMAETLQRADGFPTTIDTPKIARAARRSRTNTARPPRYTRCPAESNYLIT